MRVDVCAHLERWARWRNGAQYHGGGVSVVGRYMQGRGSIMCPTCKGVGRMPGHLVGSTLEFINVPCPQCEGAKRVTGYLDPSKRSSTVACEFCMDPKTGIANGEIAGRTCSKCRGGKRLVEHLQVHPATIKGTRYYGANEDLDPVSSLIDRTVAGWFLRNETYWLGRVVMAEYCDSGLQEQKAVRMRVSRSWYVRNLTNAHRLLYDVIKK